MTHGKLYYIIDVLIVFSYSTRPKMWRSCKSLSRCSETITLFSCVNFDTKDRTQPDPTHR